VSHATHLFNAMTPLHHRDPGIVGAALMSDIFTEVIADAIHVHPQLFQFVFDAKGFDRVVLITDSMRAGCMKDGNYDLGGSEVTVKDNTARLADGTLTGSVLKLSEAVRNVLKNTTLSVPEVIKAASLNPASTIGMAKEKGSIEVGKDADIVIFDSDFNCRRTIVQGNTVYDANRIS